MEPSGLSMYQACLLHSRAERVLKTLVSRKLSEWSLTRMEWLLLATVAEPSREKEGHTMGEIASVLDIQLSQLTALASNMNRESMLSQVTSPRDKRTKFLHITPKGIKHLKDIETDLRVAMRQWLSEVPRDRLAIYMQTVYELGNEKRIS